MAICAFAYLYVFPYQERVNNPNENVRFYMTAAIVEEGHYEIDTMRERWGWVNDAAIHDGHAYSVKAPGTSLLGVPGYAAYMGASAMMGHPFDRSEALWACRLVGSILPTLIFLWTLFGFLAAQTEHRALVDAAFFSIALGSLLYGYGMLFVSHTLSAATAFGAFMLLCGARRAEGASDARAAALGLLTAGVTLFEYPGLVCSLLLAGFAVPRLFRRRGARAVAAFTAGGLVPTLAMMHFQWRAFGSPFRPGHLMVETEAFREIHEEGLYGAVGPSLEALHGLLTHPGAGLFPLTPLLVAGVVGLWLMLRDRTQRVEAACASSIVVLTVLAISSMANWRGGWTIGPRYLALCVPFLGWAALVALCRLADRAPATAATAGTGALITALIASGWPSAYYPHLPPELTRPVPQLLSLLLRHDYAPHNLGNLFGVYGSVSMLPLLLCGALCVWRCLAVFEGARNRLLALGSTTALAVALTLPLCWRPRAEPGVAQAVAFVTRRWSPAGHDKASRMADALRGRRSIRDRELERLADVYTLEGRTREAKRALRGRF